MNINLTLIGQTVAFIVFVSFCMKFIWPPIMRALEERKTRIADGLAAAERGHHEKELAEQRAKDILVQAREQAKEIIAGAQRRGDEIVDEAKGEARVEGQRLLTAAKADVDQQMNLAREELRGEVVKLAVSGAEQVLMKEVDAAAHSEALQKLAARL